MPEQMTIDEVNRYIHVELLGKCPHDKQTRIEYPPIYPKTENSGWDMKCDACGSVSVTIRNYCSDDSPRRLLEEVIAKIEPLVVIRHPASCGRSELESAQRLVNTMFNSLNLTAEQIARAIVELHKQETTDA